MPGNIARLIIAVTGGWLALRWGGGLSGVFTTQGVALVIYGLIITAAVAGGAWFGRVGWSRSTRSLLSRLPFARV